MRGIQALHEKKIVHRDIKPENILLADDPDEYFKIAYKICDLGVSKQGEVLKSVIGTLPYMAPDYFSPDHYNLAVDLWALGVLIDEVIHKRMFYYGVQDKEIVRQVI